MTSTRRGGGRGGREVGVAAALVFGVAWREWRRDARRLVGEVEHMSEGLAVAKCVATRPVARRERRGETCGRREYWSDGLGVGV